MWRVVGDDRRAPKGSPDRDAAWENHIDDGYVWSFVSGTRGGRGRPDAGNAGRPPEELRAAGTDNAAVEDGQNQRSTRRSSQDAKRCVQDAKRCDKETVGRDNDAPENDRRKRLRIAKLGEQVRDDASGDESSREGT